jgi:hypothetical protein
VLSLATGGTLRSLAKAKLKSSFVTKRVLRVLTVFDAAATATSLSHSLGRTSASMAVDKPFTVYAPGLAGVPKEERYMSPGVVRRIVARGDANLTLRKVLRMLKSNEPAWKDFIDDMQSIFAGIEIAMEFDEDTDENINVYFQFPGGTRLPVDAAGTSVLQASQILATSLFSRPRCSFWTSRTHICTRTTSAYFVT